VEALSFPAKARATIRRYLKWYTVPFIYFLLTSLVCTYAWYTRPIPHRPAIKAVFKTIALNPTLILTGAITVWIIGSVILIPILFKLKKGFPEHSISNKSTDLSQGEDFLQTPFSNTTPITFWSKAVNVSISVLGVVLIVAGLSVAVWISRPYITFLFSPSKIESLEKKAELLGQVQEEKIKESKEPEQMVEVLQRDAPKNEALEKATEHIEQPQRDVLKESVAVDTKTERTEPIRKVEIKNKGIVEQFLEIRQREVNKKTERLEKAAEGIEQSKENRIIIPTALVDAPILEGIDMEKLSEGVCHVSKSAVPGKGGNCILEGHNIGEFGWWRTQGPFNMLEILDQGIRIHVFYKGKKYVYKVKEKTSMDVNDPKLYDFSSGERLTLITCAASWDPTIYTNRRTVIIAYPE
jgi:LPXTG-site transpeptidase (sortase) family protein